jgi:glycerol uptake facilitator-like aquaporin
MKIQPLLAEFLGTLFFCFAGIAAILSATPAVGSGAGIVGIALAHGLALSVAVNAFGDNLKPREKKKGAGIPAPSVCTRD